MRLARVEIANFRGIKAATIELDATTVLIGENNTGKTAVLDAIRICLRDLRSRKGVVFDPLDFHLENDNADSSTAPPISITLTFHELAADEWPKPLVGELSRAGILAVDPKDGRGRVTLRVTCTNDLKLSDLVQDWVFLDWAGNPLPPSPRGLAVLQENVAYFYLSALRDASRHFDPRGPYWRPFLRSSTLTPAKKAEIEAALKAVNDQIVSSHTSFEAARDKLARVQAVVPVGTGSVVSIDALPTRIVDMLARTQIRLGTATGAKVPVDRHGEGTQSLAVLMLFSAFLDASGAKDPIVALEEPEAHLHPSAVRALWRLVEGVPGQKIITTHSGELASEVPVSAVRRLRRAGADIRVHALSAASFNASERQKFDYHVRYMRGDLLLARCWLLVEGETEVVLLPAIASHLGVDLVRASVRCVPYRASDIEIYLKAARDLGIRWCALLDNDTQGAPDLAKAQAYLAGAVQADIVHIMPHPNIEVHLCHTGFGAIYFGHLTPQLIPRVTLPVADAGYWTQVMEVLGKAKRFSKPAAAMQVLGQINGGAAVPLVLENVVRAAARVAEAG